MPQKQKLRPEEKIAIVRQCLNGELGVCKAGRLVGVNKTTIRRWIARYEAEGTEGILLCEKNREYSSDLKLNAVKDYLSGQGSSLEICKKYKIRDTRQLNNWIMVYNAHGDFNSRTYSEGGSCMKQGRETTQEERIRIAKECLASGKNYGALALKHKVSYQQVRSWTLRYEELGEAGLEDRRGHRKKNQEPRTALEKAQIEIEQLKHKLYLTEMERDLQKKLDEVVRRDAYRK